MILSLKSLLSIAEIQKSSKNGVKLQYEMCLWMIIRLLSSFIILPVSCYGFYNFSIDSSASDANDVLAFIMQLCVTIKALSFEIIKAYAELSLLIFDTFTITINYCKLFIIVGRMPMWRDKGHLAGWGARTHLETIDGYEINPLTTNGRHYVETDQLICSANQLTGSYMTRNTGR